MGLVHNIKILLNVLSEVYNIEILLNVLGCKHGTLPMKFLGLHLGIKFKDKTIWNLILEKVQSRLVG